MKGLFYGLLLANVALFAWIWQRPSDMATPVATSSVQAQAAPRLILVGEINEPLPERVSLPSPEPTVAPAEVVESVAEEGSQPVEVSLPAPPVSRCIRLGKLEKEEGAKQVAAALSKGGGTDIRQGNEPGEISRYWVMLPPFKSAQAAGPALERLKRGGIKDFYLVRSGDNQNAVSLGVYSKREAAERRYRQIREMKLTAKIDEIVLPVTRWWVEFSWAEAEGEEWRGSLPGAYQEIAAGSCR